MEVHKITLANKKILDLKLLIITIQPNNFIFAAKGENRTRKHFTRPPGLLKLLTKNTSPPDKFRPVWSWLGITILTQPTVVVSDIFS